MSEATFYGRVVGGVVQWDAGPGPFAQALEALEGQRVVLTLSTEKQRRSTKANALWWVAVVPHFQAIWSKARQDHGLPPYDRDETHDVLVQVLVGYEDGPVPGTRVRKRTRRMDTEQFSDLIQAAQHMAIHDYQSPIDLPEDR